MPGTVVGTGADWWHRPTNRYPGCTCPPSRYDPREPKPTNPECPEHGDNYRPLDLVPLAELKESFNVQSA